MAERFKFFQHRECEYFPCHKGVKEENFNCLFCYCPLYFLGDRCGGNFSYTKNGVKNCMGCSRPHRRENYDVIIARIKEAIGTQNKPCPVEESLAEGKKA